MPIPTIDEIKHHLDIPVDDRRFDDRFTLDRDAAVEWISEYLRYDITTRYVDTDIPEPIQAVIIELTRKIFDRETIKADGAIVTLLHPYRNLLTANTEITQTATDASVTEVLKHIWDQAKLVNNDPWPDNKIPMSVLRTDQLQPQLHSLDYLTRPEITALIQSQGAVDPGGQTVDLSAYATKFSLENFAFVANDDVVPDTKIPDNITRDSELDAAISGFLSGTEIDTKISTATADFLNESEIDTKITEATDDFLNESQVDARVKLGTDEVQLDSDTVIQIGPAFVVGETEQRNLYLSIQHPLGAYPDANILSVSIQGATPNLQSYDPNEIQAEYTIGLTKTEITNLQSHLVEGNYVLVDVRLTNGRNGPIEFFRNVYIPVEVAPAAPDSGLTEIQVDARIKAEVDDDFVLDLAQSSRSSSDRGKFLGTSSSNENELTLLDAPSSTGGLNQNQVDARVEAVVDKDFVDDLDVDADTLDGRDSTYLLNYNNLNNKPNIPDISGLLNQDQVDARISSLVNDDRILDLAKSSRGSGDRGKFLGTSSSDENDIVLLDAPDTTIADDSITGAKLADKTVPQEKLAFNSVGGRELIDDSVATAHLKDASVTDPKIPNNTIKTRHVAADQIEQGHMKDNSIGEPELIDGGVTEDKLSTAVKTKLNATGTQGGSQRAFGSGSGQIAAWAEGDDTSKLPIAKIPDAVATDTELAAVKATADAANTRSNENTREVRTARSEIQTNAAAITAAKAEVQLDADTVIQIWPPFIAGETAQKNIYVSVKHPLNAYSDANILSVAIQGATPNLQEYEPNELQAEYTVGLTATEIRNLRAHLVEGNYILVDVRFTNGRNGPIEFFRNVYVPVMAQPSYTDLADRPTIPAAPTDFAGVKIVANETAFMAASSSTDEHIYLWP